MTRNVYVAICTIAMALGLNTHAGDWQLLTNRKIWDQGNHNAFTDLIRYQGQWFCTFRESQAHVGGNGKIRVLTSRDGAQWNSAALLEEPGIDLRDPKLSIAGDGRLMLVMGGSIYEGKVLKEKQPRVSFSKDARTWTAPQRVLEKGEWLWRVTWNKGHAYGLSYSSTTQAGPAGEWKLKLVESADGVSYSTVTNFDIPGRPNEATMRFLKDDRCVALVRREAKDLQAWIGVSAPPYRDWKWTPAGMQVGGPNFLALDDGTMVAAGRQYNPAPTGPKMFVGPMTMNSVTADVVLPSGGDCSYPGMVWHENTLWVTYYSSHEGKTSIYLATLGRK